MTELLELDVEEATPGKPFYLYRWYDPAGVLLYVGISTDPSRRSAGHWSDSWWSHWADRVAIEATPCAQDRTSAEAVERAVIASEVPIFNKLGADSEVRSRLVGYIIQRGGNPHEHLRRLPPRPKSVVIDKQSPSAFLVDFGFEPLPDFEAIKDDVRRGTRAHRMLVSLDAAEQRLDEIRNTLRNVRREAIGRARASREMPDTEIAEWVGCSLKVVQASYCAHPDDDRDDWNEVDF